MHTARRRCIACSPETLNPPQVPRAPWRSAPVLHSSDIVFIGLAITSSWGNGHATTYRSLLQGLHQRGHRVLFLERDQPWYAQHRDAPHLECCDTQLYADLHDLRTRFAER